MKETENPLFDNKPKFQLNFRKNSPVRPQSLDKNVVSLKEIKEKLDFEILQKKKQALQIKESRIKRPNYHDNPKENPIGFVRKTKERLIQRKKQEKIDWDKKLYSYSAQKEKQERELKEKQSHIQSLRGNQLQKKKSKVDEKKTQELERISLYAKEKFRAEKQEKKSKEKNSKEKNSKEKKSKEKKSKSKEKNSKNSKKEVMPMSFSRPEPKIAFLNYSSFKNQQKEYIRAKDPEKAKEDLDLRVQEYQRTLLENKKKLQKDKRKRSKKLLKIQEKAKKIRETCRKKPFVPKQDFNDPTLIQEDFLINASFEKKREEEFLQEQEDYKQMKFKHENTKKKSETRIVGKPNKQNKQKKLIKEMKNNDLELFKYPKKKQSKMDEQEIEIDNVEKMMKTEKFSKETQNKKTLQVVSMNKALKDAKLKGLPQSILESAELQGYKEEENVIEKSLRNYQEEKGKRKEKPLKIKEIDEEKQMEFLGLKNPIKEFQKEIREDFKKKPMEKKKTIEKEEDFIDNYQEDYPMKEFQKEIREDLNKKQKEKKKTLQKEDDLIEKYKEEFEFEDQEEDSMMNEIMESGFPEEL